MSVVIETTLGDITVDLYMEQRPVTCLNFLKLCKMKYYNFNLFHSIRSGFIAQTGDPTGEGSGGEAIFGILEGPAKRFFMGEKLPKIRHSNTGTLSMVCTGDMMVGSQFFFTLAPDLDSLDSVHCVFGEVTEGHDVLRKLNDVICDESHRPYRDVRITHTVVLEDPFNDPTGFRVPSRSPSPSVERLKGGRIAPDEDIDEAQGKTAEEVQELIEEKEAKARATILEIVGDLPDADIAPPENVLFVCKLNPVTTDEDLEIIFSRFGKIVGCEVIRDKRTSDSLQYAFVEFSDKKSCEDAYFKMDNVLIDDRRIHVDFSQSVSRMKWFGKGRGVKYFNDNEPKDKSVNNNSSKIFNDNHERESKNGKIDGNKSPKSKDHKDHHKSDRDGRYKKSDKDRSRRSRSKKRSQSEKKRHMSKRDRSESRTMDISRKRRSRSRSGSKSRKDRSRSRERSQREQNIRSVGHSSRSGHRSRRDRSRSKTETLRTTRDRSRTSNRKEKLRKEKTETHKEKSLSKAESDIPQETLSIENRGRGYSTSMERQCKVHQSQDENSQKFDSVQINSIINYQSVSPKEKLKGGKSVSEPINKSEDQPEAVKQYVINQNETILPTEDEKLCLNKNSSNHTGNKDNDSITKEDPKEISKKREYRDQDNKKKQGLVIEEEKPIKDVIKKCVEKDPRTLTPVIKKKDIKSKIKDKTKQRKLKKNRKDSTAKRKRKPSTSSSSSESSSSDSSSSSEDSRKKKSLKRRKKKRSTSSSSSSSSSGSSSSSSTDSSSSSSTSSDSEPVKKKHKKNASSKVIKNKKTKKKP